MKNNLLTRVVVAFVFAPLIIYITLLGKLPFLIFIEALIILGFTSFNLPQGEREFYRSNSTR
jgi:hypothetical protein